MTTTITQPEQLDDYSLGSLFEDRQGDLWMIDTHRHHGTETILVSPETSSASASLVLKKWGPLTLRWTSGGSRPAAATAPALCACEPLVAPSQEEVASIVANVQPGFDPTDAARVIAELYANQPPVSTVVEQYRRADGYTPALRDIALERSKHVQMGYSEHYDDEHGANHLEAQARLYLDHAQGDRAGYVQAAALLVAAIELLDRSQDVLAERRRICTCASCRFRKDA